MKLHLTQSPPQHKGACTSLAWSLTSQLISIGDDGSLWRWNVNGESQGQILALEAAVVAAQWVPAHGRGKGATGPGKSDMLVVACADGHLRYVSLSTNRVEKNIEAHNGAVTSLAFHPDGSSFVSGGEDGIIKMWSQAGMQRNVVASTGQAVHTIIWGPEGGEHGTECFLYSSGRDLCIRWLNPSTGKKPLQWKAHDGTVLKADWSRTNGLIVTAAEDGRYRIWDCYGRMIFSSTAYESPITSVAFSPDGDYLAVGTMNQLRICDRTGWTYVRESLQSGSVTSLAWSQDGTQLAAAGSIGTVALAHLIHRSVVWRNYTCTMTESHRVTVMDMASEQVEDLDHRDKIIKMAVGYGYLIVVTTTQAVVYNLLQWNTPPTQIDIKEAVISVLLCERYCAIVDAVSGVMTYSYDGRSLSSLRVSARLASLSSDTIAVQEYEDLRKINFYDTSTAKPVRDASVVHTMEVIDLALSQFGSLQERKLVFLDRNRDLHIVCVHQKTPILKLCTMVSSFKWSDVSEVLVVLADCKLVTWFCPGIVFTDRDLLANTKSTVSGTEFGRNDVVVDFSGTRYSVRRGTDGANLTFTIPPFATMLYAHVAKADWEAATRLCRLAKDTCLWSVLCCLTVRAPQLPTAEICYAALEEVDKVRHMRHIREITVAEGQQAELALFQRRIEEAERILLQAGLVYRVIRMHIRLYNWERALEIAVERRTHIDTVLAFRQKYLEGFQKPESNEKFRQMSSSIKVDWDVINAKIKEEKEKEKSQRKR
eukprot:PhF_6_TR37224/c0_g1_i1/m.54912/K19678/IFT80; intraflagellar transport protein 80